MKRHDLMHVGLFLKATGHHFAAWHHPGVQLDAATNVEHFVECAKLAEQAGFDFIFFADSLAVREGSMEDICRFSQFTAYLEPLTLLSAIAMKTQRIGLVSTATTSYNEPFHVARKSASLDHISHGRAGWNVVTSGNHAEALNFGRKAHFEHALRYQRAAEFVEVVKALWDSWEAGALTFDRQSGNFFDPSKVHVVNHVGEFFNVRGPLNVARPPQGRPVIFQAGTSEAGRQLAAATGEGIFSSELTATSSAGYYRDVKDRAARLGRQPSEILVLPGLTPVVGRTEAEAREKNAYLQSLIAPDVGRDFLAELLGMDLSNVSVDDPLPDRPKKAGSQGVIAAVTKLAESENLSVKQLYRRLGGSYGKLELVGSASQIVDEMESWFHGQSCDGFILQPPVLPVDLHDIVNLLIPELQNRGLIRVGYEGVTLRDHLGFSQA